ncbi:phosphoribosyltransferase [Sulfurimonas sp. SWIR-19]|uniref:phosphoribosyltransferase n=1 Tax=Sulfurimonas sp. SWIR-19 TaxID=2878390 RepID=UPI001CF4C9AB|nr:phosphoribosyltransferase family protein [Sulfurimonas sp. SWIR-19]UCN00697.1 phosphoribosyltransferase [Sulfurimonas sp. SWIR-19]
MKQYYSYENFRNDTQKLILEVKNFNADAIVSVARGGFTLAHCLAEGLDIRDVQSIRTELYDVTCKRKELSLFGTCSLADVQRVLVVDDIADSGETLAYVMQHLQKNFPEAVFKSSTLFYKKTSIYKPDFWINEADAWIEFFWEKDFSLAG